MLHTDVNRSLAVIPVSLIVLKTFDHRELISSHLYDYKFIENIISTNLWMANSFFAAILETINATLSAKEIFDKHNNKVIHR